MRDEEAVRLLVSVTVKELVATVVSDSDIDCEAIHVFDSDSLLVDEFVGDTRCLDAEPLLEIVLLLDGVRDGLTLPDRVRVIVVEVVASSLVVLVLL